MNYENLKDLIFFGSAIGMLILIFLSLRWKKNSLILLPKDKVIISQLEKKLEEYEKRINQYRAPELQMDPICKISILQNLLDKGFVIPSELDLEMKKNYGSGFSDTTFKNAICVIKDYIKTGGKNLRGGTGFLS